MPLRIMLDTNAHDSIIIRSDLLRIVARAIGDGVIDVVRISVQEFELSQIEDQEKRNTALAVPGRKVATYGIIPDWFVPGEARPADGGRKIKLKVMHNGNPKYAADALIAATAEMEADVMVTNEKRLPERIARTGTELRVWSFYEFEQFLKSL